MKKRATPARAWEPGSVSSSVLVFDPCRARSRSVNRVGKLDLDA